MTGWEAFGTGRKARHATWTKSEYMAAQEWFDRGPLRIVDFLNEPGWEVQPPTVTVTWEQVRSAVDEAVIGQVDALSYPIIKKRLGFPEDI